MGLPSSAVWPRTAVTKTLTDEQIAIAREEIKKMADMETELEQALTEHAQRIQVIEGFMEEFAKRVDPTKLQGFLDRIKQHTSRLDTLMARFPIVK